MLCVMGESLLASLDLLSGERLLKKNQNRFNIVEGKYQNDKTLTHASYKICFVSPKGLLVFWMLFFLTSYIRIDVMLKDY